MLSTPEIPRPETGNLFRRSVVIITSLSLAAVYGWLACYELQTPGTFYFDWRWNGLLWFFIGLGSTVYFWHKIWPSGGRSPALRKDVIKGSLAFALPNLWWLTFPLRFSYHQQSLNLMIGIIVPLMVVAIDVRMVKRLLKGFEESDAEDLKALESSGEESNAKSTGK